jgi:basic amino acid/polyamine antiporter, APA family
VSNGVLVEIITLARLFYGTARQGQLPAILARVHPHTQTPLSATLLAGGLVLIAALLVPFEQLLAFTNAVTLAVFMLVDLALWRLHRIFPTGEARMMPRWVPPVAAVLCLSLLLAEMFNQ